MKRILFISQHLNRAGTEMFMMNVFRGIDHSRFGIDFLVYNWKDTDFSREVEAAGSKVWRVPCRRESLIGWYHSLIQFFHKHAKNYTAIHYNGNGLTAIAPIILAFHYGIPIRIIHSHNSSSEGLHNRLMHILQRNIAKKLTTHHFACSTEAAKWFYGSSPAVIIKNGIDTKKYSFSEEIRNNIRQKFAISPTTRVIGNVGRFQPEKNHTFLIDIFADYIKLNPDSLLILIGIGTLAEDINKKVQRLGLADKVRFMGERSDVNIILQMFDLFLMPSTFEGQPFVLIEAQCAGLPCLISDVINQDICLTPNVEFLSLGLSPTEWAIKISKMLETYHRKDERIAIEQQGYSTKNTIDYLEEVYDGIK